MLRRLINFICGLTLAAALVSVPAFAETGTVTPTKGVNMRSGPGREFQVVCTVPYGTEVTVGRNNNGWYEVSCFGQSGYVLGDYIRLASGGTPEPAGVLPASGSSPSIFLPAGQQSGSGSAQTVPQSAVPVPQQTVPAASGSSGSGSSGSAPSIFSSAGQQSGSGSSGASVPAQTSSVSYAGVLTGDYVRFRTGPSTSYTILSNLRKGTSVTVIGSYSGWLKCVVGTDTGFISAGYVAAAGSAAAASASSGTVPGASSSAPSIFLPAGQQSGSAASGAVIPAQVQPAVTKVTQKLGYIAGSNVRFRGGPSVNSEILGEFQFGNSVYITGYCGDWTEASADGRTGFVSSRYVREGVYAPAARAASASSGTSAAPASSGVSAAPASSGTSAASAAVPVQNTASVPQTGSAGSVSAAPADTASADTASAVAQTGASSTAAVGPVVPVTGQQIADLAVSLTGTGYKWAGSDPETGFDCSGLVWYVYNSFGIPVNRTAADQALNGNRVDLENARPGDIICFYTGNDVSHSGIYIGDNQFVHAASSATGVVVTELTGYYARRGCEVRRIIT